MRELIIGASGSGKSEYAENLLKGKPNLIYLATMQPFGEEGAQRVARHRKLRAGKGFQTVEQYTDIGSVPLPQNAHVLLECMGNLVANELFLVKGDAEKRILCGLEKLQSRCESLLVVTNDVFCDGESYDEETMAYIRCLGRVNKALAQSYGGVTEVVCSVGVKYNAPAP